MVTKGCAVPPASRRWRPAAAGPRPAERQEVPEAGAALLFSGSSVSGATPSKCGSRGSAQHGPGAEGDHTVSHVCGTVAFF